MSLPSVGPKVGHEIGVRMAQGKRIPIRVLKSLTRAQFTALILALSARGKRLTAALERELRDHYR